MPEPFAVAVVGAGFSGVMTAAHLLRARAARPLRVVMVNRSGAMARGVAYGTNSPGHLLNVPAGRMTAFPDDPGHFARYAHSRDPSITPAAFVRRSLYGEYLESILAESVEHAPPNELERVVAEVVSIRPDVTGAEITTNTGSTVRVNRVVLAVGHYPPAHPPGLPADLLASPLYVRDPWAKTALAAVPTHLPALLVGTGLTTLDVSIDLHARGVPGVVAVSRRGLLPQPHDTSVAPADASHRPLDIEGTQTIRGYVRAIRARVRQVERDGGNWRQVVDSLRAITPHLWQRLSVAEKRRFFRHLRPYWDVHRHRAAPETMAAVERLKASGWLTVRAARFQTVEIDGDGVNVTLMPNKAKATETVRVGAVVNCTGPSADVTTAHDPLLQRLFADGLARPDPLGVGIEVAESGAVVRADGSTCGVVSYVGPLLRARDSEGTAVPELRVHAARLAARLVEEAGG